MFDVVGLEAKDIGDPFAGVGQVHVAGMGHFRLEKHARHVVGDLLQALMAGVVVQGLLAGMARQALAVFMMLIQRAQDFPTQACQAFLFAQAEHARQ